MGFIGMVDSYEQYKQEQKTNNADVTSGNKISYDDMPEISNEDLNILMNTRNRHNPYLVYMQSDVSFYDSYYNVSDEDVGIDIELLKEAKNIKRVYKNYPDYEAALYIRNKYIDAVIDKYGGQDIYDFYNSIGAIKDWIPPIPIYSKSSRDYDLIVNGIYTGDLSDKWDDDELRHMLAIFADELELDVSELNFVSEVTTDPMVIANIPNMEDKKNSAVTYRGTPNNTIGTVSADDLEGIQQLIRSWWSDDKPEKMDDTTQEQFFSKSPDNIRAEYYNETEISLSVLTEAFKNGYLEEVDDYDPDKMVIDPATNRPMTASELQTRTFIRNLVQNGWNEMRLLRHFGVGSNYELRLIEQRQRNKKIANKKAKSFMSDFLGEDIDTIDDIDSLNDILFED